MENDKKYVEKDKNGMGQKWARMEDTLCRFYKRNNSHPA